MSRMFDNPRFDERSNLSCDLEQCICIPTAYTVSHDVYRSDTPNDFLRVVFPHLEVLVFVPASPLMVSQGFLVSWLKSSPARRGTLADSPPSRA